VLKPSRIKKYYEHKKSSDRLSHPTCACRSKRHAILSRRRIIAIDADTKPIPSWFVGDRSLDSVTQFIDDLKGRLAHRVQLTSDGYRPFLEAMEAAVGSEID
jgi:hypothetical protein